MGVGLCLRGTAHVLFASIRLQLLLFLLSVSILHLESTALSDLSIRRRKHFSPSLHNFIQFYQAGSLSLSLQVPSVLTFSLSESY